MKQETRDNKIRLLLDLVLKLNDTFLQASDLEDVLSAVLVGVTAGEGLGFNRAFLFRVNEDTHCIEGSTAIGPSSREEAAEIWREIDERSLSLFDIMLNVRLRLRNRAAPLVNLIENISVSLDDSDHVLVSSLVGRNALHVEREDSVRLHGCEELCFLLDVDEFAVVPLVTHQQAFGLIVADNFITGNAVTESDLDALHLFAGLGSIAICQANMCSLMEDRIVDLQRLNNEVVRSRGLLIQAERNAVLGKMADQLLHELRNPLSAIGGMAGMLQKRADENADIRKYTESIVEQCARMERTLQDMFSLFRAPDVNQEDIRLYQLISASVDIFRHEMQRLNISCALHLLEPEPSVRADRTYFQQALINVLKNAVEAMPDGGHLDVSVEYDNDNVRIKIKDSGLGIARGHLNRLDEPFFTTKTQAMGFGLSLGKKVLEQHGGTLSIEHNSSGGATVMLCLPVSVSE